MNLYSNPEKFGLTIVGEIDWSSGCYEFDITAVYRRPGGQLVYAEDSGCSCPEPFGDQGWDDLTPCTAAELQAHLEKRQHEHAYLPEDEGYRAAEIADLMQKVANP